MKQILVLIVGFLFLSTFCADLKKKSTQYVYLIPIKEQEITQPIDMILVKTNPHLVFKYLESQDCNLRNQAIYYYKIPSKAFKKCKAFERDKKDLNWAQYKETKNLSRAQEDHLFMDAGLLAYRKLSYGEIIGALFKPFDQIFIASSLKLVDHKLRDWKTDKLRRSTSL